MPTLDPTIQKAYKKLAFCLHKALRAPQQGQQSDVQWGVWALAPQAWKITHPELPTVRDDAGVTKDVLLQLHVYHESDGPWMVVAQNKVVGPSSHASPLAMIVAKEKQPPTEWDMDAIGQAAANFFKQQKQNLVTQAQSLMQESPPELQQPEEEIGPQPGAGGISAALYKTIPPELVAGYNEADPADSFEPADAVIYYSPNPYKYNPLKMDDHSEMGRLSRRRNVAGFRTAEVHLMTQQDFDKYCELAGIHPVDIPAVTRDLRYRLQQIASLLENGERAWRGHGYAYRALTPNMTKWEATDGSILDTSSLLGMMIHALGRDVDLIESGNTWMDYIIKIPFRQEAFEAGEEIPPNPRSRLDREMGGF